MGRHFPRDGLWLADRLDEAVAQIVPICRAVGYRRQDVCVWRDGSVPRFWVSTPGGQGGIGVETMAEAEQVRDQYSPLLGVLVIRSAGKTPARVSLENASWSPSREGLAS